MAFIPATNVVQTEMIFTWDNQIVENVLHYQVPGGVTEAAMNFIGADLVSWWNVNLKALMPTTLALTEIRMSDLTTEFAPGVSWFAGLPIVGTSGSQSLPNNVAVSITKRTNLRGRAYRGRIYHIGLSEAVVTGNLLVPTHATALLTAYALIRDLDMGGTIIPMVVLSKYQGGVARGAALATVVTAVTTDSIIDSQRRRLPGRGA